MENQELTRSSNQLDSEEPPTPEQIQQRLAAALEAQRRLSMIVPAAPKDEVRPGSDEIAEQEYLEELMPVVSSEDFSVHDLIRELHRALQLRKRGALDLLINRLIDFARFGVAYIDFYLPQLCLLALSEKPLSLRLERFIIEVALEQPDLGLKALQTYQSYMEEASSANECAMMLEQALVNGTVPSKFHTVQEDETGVVVRMLEAEHLVLTHDDYIDKVHKADYVNLQVEFVDSLTQLSVSLKNITGEPERLAAERKELMATTLHSLNDWLDHSVRGHEIYSQSRSLFHSGLVLPLYSAEPLPADCFVNQHSTSRPRQETRVVTGVVPELAKVFSTKMRAPYMVPL